MSAALPIQARLWLALSGAALLLGACGSAPPPVAYDAVPGGTKLAPSSAAESEILKRLDSLAPGQTTTVGGATVTADVPYFSASGRSCRYLTVADSAGSPAARKLACKEGAGAAANEERDWFFVPDVFAAPAPAVETPPAAEAPSAAPTTERLAPLPEDD